MTYLQKISETAGWGISRGRSGSHGTSGVPWAFPRGWKSANRGWRPTRSRRRQEVSLFAALVRQNNQNSQNEPGMSPGINEIKKRGVKGRRLDPVSFVDPIYLSH